MPNVDPIDGYDYDSGSGSSTASDIGSILSGSQGALTGIASIIGALSGKPQSVTYVSNTPSSGTISPILLIGGGLVLFVVLFMVLKEE